MGKWKLVLQAQVHIPRLAQEMLWLGKDLKVIICGSSDLPQTPMNSSRIMQMVIKGSQRRVYLHLSLAVGSKWKARIQ